LTKKKKEKKMAIDLKSIKVGREATPPKIFIYGTEGIGKSLWASTAPNPIFTQTEDRLAHIDTAKFPLSESYEDACETIKVLLNSDHDYKTHVTDSADWLEKLIHKKVCNDAGEDSIVSNVKGSPLSFGRGYVMAENLFRNYLKGLEALRYKKNMAIIVTGHALVKKFDDPMRESYDQYIPSLHERVREAIKQWADCIFFCNYEIALRKSSDGDSKAVSSGRRIIYTERRASFEAKNSYDLPPELPMEKEEGFEVFREAYSAWMKPETKKSKKSA
jgi:hypothetical protein